jgi:hypothetical protein
MIGRGGAFRGQLRGRIGFGQEGAISVAPRYMALRLGHMGREPPHDGMLSHAILLNLSDSSPD